MVTKEEAKKEVKRLIELYLKDKEKWHINFIKEEKFETTSGKAHAYLASISRKL